MSPITGYVSGCLGSVQPFAFDPATIAWVNAVITNGGTVSLGRENIVNNLIVGLRADGLFSKLDRLWLLAAENTPSALTDIISDSLATAVNSPTFTTDRGYAGDGATSYVSTNYNTSTNATNYTLNSSHLSSWDVTVNTTNQMTPIGNSDGTNQSILQFSTGGNITGCTNASAPFNYGAYSTTGHYLLSRTSSSNTIFYGNGVQFGSAAGTSSNALPNATVNVGNRNGGSTFSTDQIAAASIGAGFSSTDASNFYNRLRTYMTAVGVP